MAEAYGSLQLTIDPISRILSQCSDPLSNPLHFTTDTHLMERGHRYFAYAQLRESNLRSKLLQISQLSDTPTPEFTPPVKKSVKFIDSGKKRRSSVLAQSVPDFSSATRKENRRPPPDNYVSRIPKAGKCVTPPVAGSNSKKEKVYGSGGGSKSVNTGEKQRVMMIGGRKSYASMEELKGLSIAASNAINGETRGGKRINVLRKSTVFSSRYY